MVVRRSGTEPGSLVATLIARTCRNEQTIGMYMRECHVETLRAVEQRFARQLSKIVKVSDVDKEHPADHTYIPTHIIWDIEVEQGAHGGRVAALEMG